MAMKQLTTALQEFNDRYYTHRLPAEIVSDFGTLLKRYVKDIHTACAAGESEEHTKKIINTFLEVGFYHDAAFQINTSSHIDSTIKHENKLLALIEAKKTNNKTEMVSAENINKKALWELILYYLLETRDTTGKRVARKKDVEIRRLMITDGLKWALIDATDLEGLCDGYLEKHFFKYRNSQLTYVSDNLKFYEDIRLHLENLNVSKRLPFVFFDVEKMQHRRKIGPISIRPLARNFYLNLGLVKRPPHIRSMIAFIKSFCISLV